MNVNMDSFVNKLRNTVSQVAFTVNTSVNTVIPGNLINREYELLCKRGVYGCPGLLWEIHDAIKKTNNSLIPSSLNQSNNNQSQQGQQFSTTGQEFQGGSSNLYQQQLYSAFMFDKRQLDRVTSNKIDRDIVIEHIKKSITQLTRLRHPSILIVHHPLEDSRSTLAFVTEHVYGNVDTILRNQHRQEKRHNIGNATKNSNLVDFTAQSDGINVQSNDDDDECHLDIVQIKSGLLQIADGLNFLHNDAKLLHSNLCLENIFINSNFVWKMAGFDFCAAPISNNSSSQLDKSLSPLDDSVISDEKRYKSLRDIYASLPSCIIPNWSYTAPEHSNSATVTIAADIYSIGLISCVAFKCLEKYTDLGYETGLLSDTYKRGIATREILDELPSSLKSQLMKFVSLNSQTRPTLADYCQLTIFQDMQVQTLRCLDATFTWDSVKKIQFYSSLKEVLPQLSHQVKINRVFHALVREFFDSSMIVHVLPNVLLIAKESNAREFKSNIFPKLSSLFPSSQNTLSPALSDSKIAIMLMESLPDLVQRATMCLESFRDYSMALVFASLTINCQQQLQELCLTTLPSVKQLLDDTKIKEKLVLCLRQLCHGTTNLSIRVKCLVCLGKIADKFDKWLIIEHILPLLRDVPSREPAVIMSIVGVIKVIMSAQLSPQKPSKEVIATMIIPFLYPMCVEKDLNVQQFQSITTLVKELMDFVEKEQINVLRKKSSSTETNNSIGPMALVDRHLSLNAMANKPMSKFTPTTLSQGASKHIDSLRLMD